MSVSVGLSVCLSVTGVHWRIIANLGFKIPIPIYRALRSRCMRARGKGSSPGRVEGSPRAMLATARPSCLVCPDKNAEYCDARVCLSGVCVSGRIRTSYLIKNHMSELQYTFYYCACCLYGRGPLYSDFLAILSSRVRDVKPRWYRLRLKLLEPNTEVISEFT